MTRDRRSSARSPAAWLQRCGLRPRRAAVLAVVICALALTLAVPLRIYVSQRQQLADAAQTRAQLTTEVGDLQTRVDQLNDPAYIRAQARERLRYVMPGQTPYQVQLPEVTRERATAETVGKAPDGPWYSRLWSTVRSGQG